MITKKKEELNTNKIYNEEDIELSDDDLQAVSGGVLQKTGGKPKPKFPNKCPECNGMLVVPRTNTKDTVTCVFCGAEIDALN